MWNSASPWSIAPLEKKKGNMFPSKTLSVAILKIPYLSEIFQQVAMLRFSLTPAKGLMLRHFVAQVPEVR